MENELKSENKWGNLGKNVRQKRTKREKERGCVNDLVCMGSPKVILKEFTEWIYEEQNFSQIIILVIYIYIYYGSKSGFQH